MMNAPAVATADISPTSMKVTWASITDCTLSGRDCPTYYGLEWDQGNGVWANLTTTDMGKINAFTVNFPSVFPSGQAIQFRTYAKNGVGYGEYSTVTTVNCDKVPQFMNTPYATSINPTWIELQWQDMTLDAQTGGDPIKFYSLEWEQTPNTWVTLTDPIIDGKVLVKNHSLPAGQIFPSASTQNYRVRA